ncbi:MAG TPA: SGNH/GDSL hydrolase family protein [Acidimicrobiales bacterium]|nr:SGNH/GDSL hydrolase family protein [Acidimicrobiales bacterium]
MSRYLKLLTFMVAVTVLLSLGFVAGKRSGADSSPTVRSSSGQPFYLVIGASSSQGVQPSGVPSSNSRRTQDGYANDVVALEQKKHVNFELNQIGCPGETAESMLNTAVADHCYTLPTTQLTLALNFLHANQSRAGLVTIDLGFNDIRPCLTGPQVIESCVTQGLNYVRNDLPKVLTQLKAAAGPQVHFVGFNYEDPFVAHYLEGPASIANAQETLTDMGRMDQVLNSVYANAKIPVANLEGTFESLNSSPDVIPNVGTVPVNVAFACYYTWMCQPKPFGPDDHPNNPGYMLIAEAIVKVLPGPWRIPVVH